MAAVACTAAAVVAGVAVFALNDPKEPGGGGGGPMADEPYFRTTAELESASVLIVRARLGAGHEETSDGLTETVATAEVLATAKGTSPTGGRIELAYTTPGSGPETADLAAGKEYVLLLDELDGGRFTPVNTTQGVYGVDGGHAVSRRRQRRHPERGSGQGPEADALTVPRASDRAKIADNFVGDCFGLEVGTAR